MSGGASCHTCTQQSLSSSDSHTRDYVSMGIPPWVCVLKSSLSSSRCTQCAAIAHSQQDISNIACHCRNCRARKKFMKQQRVLHEVVIPCNQYKLSIQEIEDDIIVFDGGNLTTPPILPPDGPAWRCIPISKLYVDNETNPNVGLSCLRINNSLPFIWLPRISALSIIQSSGLKRIYNALEACEKMRKVSLVRGKRKRIFTDYGKRVMYTCVGIQVSRNSPQVLDQAPFMDKVKSHHLDALMWMMRRAELCFEQIADHQVISHVCHARSLLPFKTISGSKYYGGMAFGCNVFLWCHTDSDFTMSISQVFIKGRNSYEVDDEVVVYFCFPTFRVAVPLQPGDFFMFNALISHCISS